MTVSDLDILRAAHVQLERGGDQAVTKARDIIRNPKEGGDNEAADTWFRIIVAIEVSASVYRNFREAKDFGEFVGQIKADDD